ncbi:solute carrier family 26 member 6-like [Lissotriton helveticus]
MVLGISTMQVETPPWKHQGTSRGLSEPELEKIAPKQQPEEMPLWSRARRKIRCSGPIAKPLLYKFIPILFWLPRYPIRDFLVGDIVSGLSVGILQLPQGLAYALLAGVPPVFGLYTSFFPVLVYTFFATSRHVSVGSFAMLSIMIGSVTESLAPNDNFMVPGNETLIDVVARDVTRVKVMCAVTLLTAIFQVILGLAQFGFVANFLSEPLIRGYTTAAGMHVTVSQMKYILGVQISQKSQPLSLLYSVVTLCSKLPEVNIATLVTSFIALLLLFAVKFANQTFRSRLPAPIPIELILLIVATGISYGAKLHDTFDIDIVGDIPVGMRPPSIPDADLFGKVAGSAFAIAVVGYTMTISLAKMFALKHSYKVDSNQELIALGLSNFVGSFFQCFSITASMSRTLVQESTGGNTQVAGSISALIILIIILKAGSLFEHLPKAILSAVVIANLKGIYRQFGDIPILWRTNKTDLLIWLTTFAATLLLNLDLGLAVSVIFALLTVVVRTQLPHYSILGQVGETDIYKDVTKYQQVREIPGVKIFHSSAMVYYANAERYSEALKEKSGVDIDRIIEKKKTIEQKQKESLRVIKKARKEGAVRTGRTMVGKENGFMHVDISTQSTADLEAQTECRQKTYENPTLESLGLTPPNLHSLILDISSVSFVDTVSLKMFKKIFTDFNEIGVEVYLSGGQESVIQQMENGSFFCSSITKAQLFASVHDAVTYISKTKECRIRQMSTNQLQTRL